MANDEKISALQLFLWMLTFTFGDMTILTPALASGVGQDSWIVFVIGWAIGIIIMLMYIKIIQLDPSKTMIEILRDCFGNYFGTALGFFYIIYFTYAGALVLREFGEYISIITFPETPILFIMGVFVLLVSYVVKSGPEVIARIFGILGFVFPFFVVVITMLLIPHLKADNILPVFETNWGKIFKGVQSTVAFPFGELVVFIMVFPIANSNVNIKKVALSTVIIGGAIILVTVVRDILVLGGNLLNNSTFPSYMSSELLPLNISPIVAINLLIGSSMEAATYLYAASLGITQIFNLKEYRPFVLQMAAILLIQSVWNTKSITQFNESVFNVYINLAIYIQIIIPLIILIILLIKNKLKPETHKM